MKTSRFQAPRLILAALMAVAATAALAQQGPGGPPPEGPGMGRRGPGGRMGGPERLDRLPSLARLVGRPEVADELKLSDDQLDRIQTIMESMRPQGGPPEGGAFRGGPGGEGPGQGRPGRGGPGGNGERPNGPPDPSVRDKMEAEMDAKVRAVLSASQAKRLEEIAIQTMGLSAAMVPEIQARLGLSSDQKTKLKALVPQRPEGGPDGPPPGGPMGDDRGGPPDMQGGFGGPPPGGPEGRGGQDGPGGPGGPGRRGGPDGRKKELETKIAAILTDGQKATLKSLGGKTFAMREGRRPRGGE